MEFVTVTQAPTRRQSLKAKLTRIFGTHSMDGFTIFSYFFPLVYLLLFLVAPVLTIFVYAFQENGHFSLIWFKSLFTNPVYFTTHSLTPFYYTSPGTITLIGWNFGCVINSLLLAISTTIFTTLIGVFFAYIMYRYEFPGKRVFRILLFIPLLVTPFVNARVIQQLFAPSGLINYIFYNVLHIFPCRIVIAGLVGAVVVQTMSYYPIVYLNAYASFLNIDPSLEEQAENLGSKGFHLFRTVTLPLALPGIAAGATLVFIFSLEDLAAPIVLGGNAHYLLSYQIYNTITSFTGTSPMFNTAAAMGIIILCYTFAAFFAIRKYVGLRQYAMLSKGGRWRLRTFKPKWWQYLVIYLVALPLLLFTISPQIGVVMLAFAQNAYTTAPIPTGFTFKHIEGLWWYTNIAGYIRNSFMYSIIAVGIIIALGVTSSYVANRFRCPLSTAIETLTIIPMAIPGIVIALAYYFYFHILTPGTPFDPQSLILFNAGYLLVIAYSVRRLPFAARSIYAGIQQVHVNLEEAAMNLGAKRSRTVFQVLIPLIVLNVLGGAMLSFVYCMAETSVGVTLGGLNGAAHAPISFGIKQILSGASMHPLQLAAALGFFLMVIQIIAILVSNFVTKQRYAFIGLT